MYVLFLFLFFSTPVVWSTQHTRIVLYAYVHMEFERKNALVSCIYIILFIHTQVQYVFYFYFFAYFPLATQSSCTIQCIKRPMHKDNALSRDKMIHMYLSYLHNRPNYYSLPAACSSAGRR